MRRADTVSREALQTIFDAAGAQVIAWAGARTPAHFGDPAGEYRALREGTGLLDLSWHAVLEMTGPDRVQFLNGMLSNDVRDLGSAGGCFASALTVHGKMVATVVVLSFDSRYLLVTNADRTAALAAHLDQYLIADDVVIADRAGDLSFLAVSGPNAVTLVERMGWPAPRDPWSHASAAGDIEIIRWPLTDEPSWAILVARDRLAPLWKSLVSAGAKPVGLDALNTARIEAGIPWYGVDATEESFPLETGLDDTISTTKGCYLGQETIIRILHRGHVNRTLFGLILDGDTVPPTGSEVIREEKTIGTITSAARSPRLGRVIAMAVLRVHGLEPGTKVQVLTATGPVEATIAELPFAS